jgi:NADPH:quinone reductase-like Zn-dependent oxidoreductase
MPKNIYLQNFGGPENLILRDEPSLLPRSDEVSLRIQAFAISRDNFTFMSGNQFKGHGFVRPELPSRFGYECSGIVEAVGEGVDKSWLGKKVSPLPGFDESRYGVFGTEAIIPASRLVEYPSNISALQAAAIWVPYLTAYGVLVLKADIKKGDNVVILAATSAVGIAAIQIVKENGAKAIATTRSKSRKDELISNGADYVIVMEEEDYISRIDEITENRGADITIDPISGPLIEKLAQAAAPGGTIVEYGRMSGEPAPFPLYPLIGKGLSIKGYTLNEITSNQETSDIAVRYVNERLADGRFEPKISKVFPLEKIKEAYRYIDSGERMGRVIVTVI